MDATTEEIGRNPVSKHHIQLEHGDEQAEAEGGYRTRLARPNSQARTGTGKYSFPLFIRPQAEWQSYPFDPYTCYNMCDHTYIHTLLEE